MPISASVFGLDKSLVSTEGLFGGLPAFAFSVDGK
jgi:hypothetical protein